jgi:NADH-quinone oxidoreductase subunit I
MRLGDDEKDYYLRDPRAGSAAEPLTEERA